MPTLFPSFAFSVILPYYSIPLKRCLTVISLQIGKLSCQGLGSLGGQDLKLGLVMLKSTSARSCPYSGSFLILYVPENCKIGCSLVLHTRGHQIQFPPFVLFSLQFIPRTIAKPILLNHWFHSVL